jgi:hypothetical protein
MKKLIVVMGAVIVLAACSSAGNTVSSGSGDSANTGAMPNPPATSRPISFGNTKVYAWCANDSYTDDNGNFDPSAEVYIKNVGQYSAQVANIEFEIFGPSGNILPGYDGTNSQDGLSPDNQGEPYAEIAPGTTQLFSQGGGAAVNFSTCKASIADN